MTSKRVLVVDDDEHVRVFFSEVLLRHGFHLQEAALGKDALKLLKNEKFDLVVSDIRLPDINGMDILKEVSKIENGPGVILVTGYGTVQSAVEAMKIGALIISPNLSISIRLI